MCIRRDSQRIPSFRSSCKAQRISLQRSRRTSGNLMAGYTASVAPLDLKGSRKPYKMSHNSDLKRAEVSRHLRIGSGVRRSGSGGRRRRWLRRRGLLLLHSLHGIALLVRYVLSLAVREQVRSQFKRRKNDSQASEKINDAFNFVAATDKMPSSSKLKARVKRKACKDFTRRQSSGVRATDWFSP